MASDPSSPVVSQERIQRIREVYPRDKPKCPWCGVRGGKHNFDCPTPDVWHLLLALDAATEDAHGFEGAMKAQDDREQKAGAACGIPWEAHGCDWPDSVAEAVVALKTARDVALARAAEAEQELGIAIRGWEGARADSDTARAELSRLRAERTWQPFDPNDGERKIVWREDAGVLIAEFVDETWFSDGGGEDLTGYLPTHQLPLPSAPGASQE